MTPIFVCDCKNPKPRKGGDGAEVCLRCHGRVRMKKDGVVATAKSDTMPAEELQAIQDRINRLVSSVVTFGEELTAQVQRLKKKTE